MTTPIITKSKTQPIENNSYTIHAEDAYFLVLGFEINKSPLTNPDFEEEMKQNQEEDNKPQRSAYKKSSIEDDVVGDIGQEIPFHNALTDPGHTFMYLVKNLNATIFLSVGPLVNDAERLDEYRKAHQLPDEEQINQILAKQPIAQSGYKIGHNISRAYGRGTSDYRIPEKTFLFKLKITEKQYEAIYKNVERIKKEIEQGERYYNIFDNHTCAKVVRDDAIGNILPDLPWGRSAEVSGLIQAINPYAFYEQMLEYKKKVRFIREFVIDMADKTEDEWSNFIEEIRNGNHKKLISSKMPKDIILEKGVKK
ncbi:hypothetical protein ACLSZN_10450 [Avibacterium avium]|uniref:hypothetical protein n=1 Tax=Avibacterium avium TaxID=751 RepID=UPI003BF7C68C